MRLRKEETAAMRTLIAAEYEDENDYITVLFNGVADMLAKRDSYAVGIRMFGKIVPYGPYYDVRRARKLGGQFAANMRNVQAFTTPLLAPAKLEPKE